jgi:hypothetical protein
LAKEGRVGEAEVWWTGEANSVVFGDEERKRRDDEQTKTAQYGTGQDAEAKLGLPMALEGNSTFTESKGHPASIFIISISINNGSNGDGDSDSKRHCIRNGRVDGRVQNFYKRRVRRPMYLAIGPNSSLESASLLLSPSTQSLSLSSASESRFHLSLFDPARPESLMKVFSS